LANDYADDDTPVQSRATLRPRLHQINYNPQHAEEFPSLVSRSNGIHWFEQNLYNLRYPVLLKEFASRKHTLQFLQVAAQHFQSEHRKMVEKYGDELRQSRTRNEDDDVDDILDDEESVNESPTQSDLEFLDDEEQSEVEPADTEKQEAILGKFRCKSKPCFDTLLTLALCWKADVASTVLQETQPARCLPSKFKSPEFVEDSEEDVASSDLQAPTISSQDDVQITSVNLDHKGVTTAVAVTALEHSEEDVASSDLQAPTISGQVDVPITSVNLNHTGVTTAVAVAAVEDSEEDVAPSDLQGPNVNPVADADVSTMSSQVDVPITSINIDHTEVTTGVAVATDGSFSLDVAFLIPNSNYIADGVEPAEGVRDHKSSEIVIADNSQPDAVSVSLKDSMSSAVLDAAKRTRSLAHLTESDIERAASPEQMLNDEVINCYLSLLTLHFVSDKAVHVPTFFWTTYASHGYDNVKKWLPECWSPEHTPGILLIPIHQDCHWFLISVDFVRREISLYDSLTDHSRVATKAFRVMTIHNISNSSLIVIFRI
jgi:hypothetical protein